MPSRGVRPCGNAAGPPPTPLASAYNPTAEINPRPANGPIIKSNSQKERDAHNSRHSFASSGKYVPLCTLVINIQPALSEREKNLFHAAIRKIRSRLQFRQRTFGGDLSGAQQHQSIAYAPCIYQLMN